MKTLIGEKQGNLILARNARVKIRSFFISPGNRLPTLKSTGPAPKVCIFNHFQIKIVMIVMAFFLLLVLTFF